MFLFLVFLTLGSWIQDMWRSLHHLTPWLLSFSLHLLLLSVSSPHHCRLHHNRKPNRPIRTGDVQQSSYASETGEPFLCSLVSRVSSSTLDAFWLHYSCIRRSDAVGTLLTGISWLVFFLPVMINCVSHCLKPRRWNRKFTPRLPGSSTYVVQISCLLPFLSGIQCLFPVRIPVCSWAEEHRNETLSP